MALAQTLTPLSGRVCQGGSLRGSTPDVRQAGRVPRHAPASRRPAAAAPAQRRSRGLVVTAAWTPVSRVQVPQLSLELPSEDVRESVELVALPQGRSKVITVAWVDETSACYAAGVRAGQQVLGVSDPVRQGDVWELDGRSSLKYVKEAIRMRRADTLQMRLTPEPISAWQRVMAEIEQSSGAAGAAAAAPQQGASAAAARNLERQYRMQQLAEVVRRQEAAVKEARQKKIQSYVEKQERQSLEQPQSPFKVAVPAFIFVPPLIAIIGALTTGYLDSLGPR